MDYIDSQNDSGLGESDSTPSSVHPDRFDHKHIDKVEIFSQDLQKAIANSFPRPRTSYTSVHVLLLRWAEDDLNVQQELTTLKRVFEDQFNFVAEQWDIPGRDSTQATRALQKKLYDFQDTHEDEDELLIVYYGGHGDPDRRGRSIWAANKQPDSPTLNWSSLQHLLETAIPHVLIILDCCYAANAARDTSDGTTKELLAACGRENPTLGIGVRSFTSALIEELQAFGRRPFTVAMLHSRLITMRWRLAFTPVYALLSEHGGHSIKLAPQTPSPGPVDPSESPEFDMDDDMMDISSPEASIAADTRVLLAVSITDNAVCDISEWKKWLTSQAPWDITKIEVKVEAVFESHSTILITSIPIVAWDMLPNRSAYRFIGFVRSSNLFQWPLCSNMSSQQLASFVNKKKQKLLSVKGTLQNLIQTPTLNSRNDAINVIQINLSILEENIQEILRFLEPKNQYIYKEKRSPGYPPRTEEPPKVIQGSMLPEESDAVPIDSSKLGRKARILPNPNIRNHPGQLNTYYAGSFNHLKGKQLVSSWSHSFPTADIASAIHPAFRHQINAVLPTKVLAPDTVNEQHSHEGLDLSTNSQSTSSAPTNTLVDAPVQTNPASDGPAVHRAGKANKIKIVYICKYPDCEKVFNRAELLRRHSAAHAAPTFQCPLDGCRTIFLKAEKLAIHMRKRHKILEDTIPPPSQPSVQALSQSKISLSSTFLIPSYHYPDGYLPLTRYLRYHLGLRTNQSRIPNSIASSLPARTADDWTINEVPPTYIAPPAYSE